MEQKKKGLFGFLKSKDQAVEETYDLETFSVNEGELVLKSPLSGIVMPLEKVPDPAFAEKMMGDGIAIKPTSGLLTSPIEGTVEVLYDTKHLVGLRHKSGLEMIIHIGIDTVNMKGEGFKAFVNQGDIVNKGDRLIEFDLKLIEKKAKSTITSFIMTNMTDVEYIHLLTKNQVENNENLLAIKMKKDVSVRGLTDAD
jgi:glucose-specific phosphotransferase system IIA component